MSESLRPRAPKIVRICLYATVFFLILPIIVLITGSFLDEGHLSLRWYSEILNDGDLLSSLQRSLGLGICSSLVSTLLGAMAAVALHKSDFKFKKLLNLFSILSLVLPELVFALSLLSWFFILQFHLSMMTVFAAHVSFSLSFSIFLISSRLSQLDLSIDDAARDLGANEWVILKTITLPLLRPALMGSFILCFLMSFDDFLISFFVSGVGSDTLPIRLYTSMKAGHSPKLNALSVLMMLISISGAMFLVTSKNIRKLIIK